jgi:hypothetical protein
MLDQAVCAPAIADLLGVYVAFGDFLGDQALRLPRRSIPSDDSRPGLPVPASDLRASASCRTPHDQSPNGARAAFLAVVQLSVPLAEGERLQRRT